MRPLTISDATSVLGLQQEIQRSEESRYDHRLHGVLLVAQGMTCPEVARLLGDAPRSVENWVHRFDQYGLAGLTEGERTGRPSRLDQKQVKEINRVLRAKPSDAGMRVNLWDGKTLSAWIDKTYGVQLGVRQCQRLFRQLEFRLHKPRLVLARADPLRQKKHKKTPQTDGGRYGGLVGSGRSALSAARIALPHVGSAGNQGSHCVPSSDAQERRLLCCRTSAGRQVSLPPRDGKIQRRDLLGFPESVREVSAVPGRRILAISDNAQYHRSKLHLECRDQQAPQFGLDFLPPYSPDLNPIERVWKLTRRLCLHNRYFGFLDGVAAVEDQFAEWIKPNDSLRRLCAIT